MWADAAAAEVEEEEALADFDEVEDDATGGDDEDAFGDCWEEEEDGEEFSTWVEFVAAAVVEFEFVEVVDETVAWLLVVVLLVGVVVLVAAAAAAARLLVTLVVVAIFKSSLVERVWF